MKSLALALTAGGICSSTTASAVRVNSDGFGQALIYPYYTTHSTLAGNAFVTLFTVTNASAQPKVLRVRFLEGRAGAEILNFNLFLSAKDVWTTGIVDSGTAAGIFTNDYSCTSPGVARSAESPIRFRNGSYIGDLLGDGLDRTREGYFEVLEMATIDPASELGESVTHSPDYSLPNNSKPSCLNLPMTGIVPSGLSPPTGGLMGNVSYINVNEGTDYTVAAIALSQWSDKVQWAEPGSTHPTLADASPAISHVVDSTEGSDKAYLTQWARGQDAVSALLMVDQILNDYTVEPSITAATDWILTMPTKRYYTTSRTSEAPFAGYGGENANTSYCEVRLPSCDAIEEVFDREGQAHRALLFPCLLETPTLCGAVGTVTFSVNGGGTTSSHVFQSTTKSNNVSLNAPWINGHFPYQVTSIGRSGEYEPSKTRGLPAPAGATTITDLKTGTIQVGATVTYYGLPIVGFGAQSYTNGLLVGQNGNVLSNYGGTFAHKYRRRIAVAP